MTLPAEYFAQVYAGSSDPWGFRTRWYEQRKRDLTVAALTRPRYRRAYEPGCSIGVLTAALAPRCDVLVATDLDESALGAARTSLGDRAGVLLSRLEVPAQWPAGDFDLVVLSELAYYLGPDDLDLLLDRTVSCLVAGGTVLACHWRHPVPDYPGTGDAVHDRLLARPELVAAVSHREPDFRLDLLTLGAVPSPAQREGLVG